MAAVHLVSVLHLSMDGVSIQNSTGYGLVGVNVLGYSKITMSSLIASNQYVKDMLQKTVVHGLQCNNKNNSYVYINNGSVQCQSVSGGNIYLRIKRKESLHLHLTHLLITLGVDGTFTNEPSCVGYGTGLTIYSDYQEPSIVHADIGNIVFYRNQAFHGANLNFIIEGGYDILLNAISIMQGVAMNGD